MFTRVRIIQVWVFVQSGSIEGKSPLANAVHMLGLCEHVQRVHVVFCEWLEPHHENHWLCAGGREIALCFSPCITQLLARFVSRLLRERCSLFFVVAYSIPILRSTYPKLILFRLCTPRFHPKKIFSVIAETYGMIAYSQLGTSKTRTYDCKPVGFS